VNQWEYLSRITRKGWWAVPTLQGGLLDPSLPTRVMGRVIASIDCRARGEMQSPVVSGQQKRDES
jgi:hypothetical protein